MGFEQKHDTLYCLFSENHCACGFVNTLNRGKIRPDGGRDDGCLYCHPERDGSCLEQGENSGGGGDVLHSAYILKVEPTGLVQGYKMFSVRGQIVHVLGFAGYTAAVATTQLCC